MQTNMQNKQMVGHKPKPETRDDLDSRSNEEWSTKGDDVTHGKKETKTGKSKKKN